MLSNQGKKLMNTVIDWKNEIGAIAGPFLQSDTKESWLSRAYDRIQKNNPKISYRMIECLFYGRATDPKWSVAASVLSAAEQARLEEARRDAEDLANIYRRHAETLAKTDADFHGPQINALVEAARIISGRDRP